MARPVALVTGASRGIGRRLAGDLAAAGYDVVCTARSSEEAPGRLPGTVEETARRVRAAGGRALPAALDVRDEEAVAALVERVHAEWGRCDLLVNNAAVAPPRPALEDGPKRWRLAVDVNLNGVFRSMRAEARAMRAAGGGSIVNVSSIAAVLSHRWMDAYCASKAGVNMLTVCGADDLGEHGIRVNAVAPGPIPTEGVREAFRAPGGDSASGEGGDDVRDEEGTSGEGGRHSDAFAESAVPLGRLGAPEDIGRMVTYLCSPGGDWITGAIMVVDGGEWLQKVGMAPPGAGGAG